MIILVNITKVESPVPKQTSKIYPLQLKTTRRKMRYPTCGCWFVEQGSLRNLPQVNLKSHTTILATTSRTKLQQVFINDHASRLSEVSYTFPLYDGISVVSFRCVINDHVITGIVKGRHQAKSEFNDAVAKGQNAGLLEQSDAAADVFSTSLGNVPANTEVLVEITYVGELKNDAEIGGTRFTIPTEIGPRYGYSASDSAVPSQQQITGSAAGISIIVDVALEEGSHIRSIRSPSHPIAVEMGRSSTSVQDDDEFNSSLAFASLTSDTTGLGQDFVIIVQAKDQGMPHALLETHPDLPNQRALAATLIPKFNLPTSDPEIVFVCDRSGSMGGKMHLVIEALKVFLKSLPIGTKFNICSFGSHHSFLFERSATYDEDTLKQAMSSLDGRKFSANYGGTEMISPIKDVLDRRYNDLDLNIMLLTDGQIWNQQDLFNLINEASEKRTRIFTLGIGSGASSSLIEGVARAGNGFAQWVDTGEKIDKRIVRMLKAALIPHLDYKIDIVCSSETTDEHDDFEIIESFEKSMSMVDQTKSQSFQTTTKTISLYDPSISDQNEDSITPRGRYDNLPALAAPNVLQVPYNIPPLYPHSRTSVYVLLGPGSSQGTPTSIVLHAASSHGELRLDIPIKDVGMGTTIHQLAAKKAMQDLEEGRGWIAKAKTRDGKSYKTAHESKWDLIVEREAVRLGTTFQVAGKNCSFVAIDNRGRITNTRKDETREEESLPVYSSSPYASSPLPMLSQQGPGSGPVHLSEAKKRSAGSFQPALFGNILKSVQSASLMSTQSMKKAAPQSYAAPSLLSFDEDSAVRAPPPPPARRQMFARNTRDRCRERDLEPEPAERRKSETKTIQSMTLVESMHKVIEFQTFSGSWKAGETLFKILNRDIKRKITDGVSATRIMNVNDEDSACTILAITWLKTVMADESDVWELVVAKAESWLKQRIGAETEPALERARACF